MSRIIFLNGPSSSGKSSIAKELQGLLPEPFWYVASDQFVDAGMLPEPYRKDRQYWWNTMRPRFFDAFHRCLAAMADTGNDLIVDHVIEFEGWMTELVELLHPHDVFFVGVMCNLAELERRERVRGDRTIGEARDHQEVVHSFGEYDFRIDSSQNDPQACALSIIEAWKVRPTPSAFQRMSIPRTRSSI